MSFQASVCVAAYFCMMVADPFISALMAAASAALADWRLCLVPRMMTSSSSSVSSSSSTSYTTETHEHMSVNSCQVSHSHLPLHKAWV